MSSPGSPRAIKADDLARFEALHSFGFDDLNNYLTFDGRSFLFLVAESDQACKFGSKKILDYLLQMTSLNPLLRDKKGRTALDYAHEVGSSADIINSLAGLH